jgi:putative heme uptake system protein
MAERTTYLLVDGENIDATLGNSILGRRPRPEERPRWDRLLEHVERDLDQPVVGLFFLAVTTELPAPFVQALLAMGFRPVPLTGPGKVVDIGIQRTLEAIADRSPEESADVVLASHDGDFVPQVERLCDGSRQVGIVGFGEFVNAGFRGLPGLRVVDLELDVGAFNAPLPRVRVIPIDEFDPLEFL